MCYNCLAMKLAHYADPSQPNIGDLRDSELL